MKDETSLEKSKIKCLDCGALFTTTWGSQELKDHQEGHKFKGFVELD